jgi:RHS repeat-associated protein
MTPTPVDLFAEEITYNGLDISRIDQIGSCTAGLIRNRYSYDADHRLTQVDNTLFNPYEVEDAFSASYSYDPAGNLISLKRNGWRDAVQDYVLIDDISYAYSGNNSVLTSVQEQTGLPEGLAASSHYSYDLNGNLIGDTGKGITQIDYNLLNLPVKVTGQGGGILEFEYTFGGEKIRKNNEHEREYLGGLEYKNNVLELIHFPNGRIDKTGTVDTFQYYLTDHLGNIVVLFQDTDGDGVIALEEETNGAMDEVIQRNYYYSFGLRVDSPDFQIGEEPKNNYLYNGKELNEELGLNWLDYGARWYMPEIGRWNAVDPLAEQRSWVSPYNYVQNNPINRIDPTGALDDIIDINKSTGEISITEAKGDDIVRLIENGNVQETLGTGQKPDLGSYPSIVNNKLSDQVQSESKDTVELCFSFSNVFYRDPFSIFNHPFACFECPDKSDCQDEHQGIDPVQMSEVGIFKIEASRLATPEEYFNSPPLSIESIPVR